MIADKNLMATGGSDYHGPHLGRPNPLGTPNVPWKSILRLENSAKLWPSNKLGNLVGGDFGDFDTAVVGTSLFRQGDEAVLLQELKVYPAVTVR